MRDSGRAAGWSNVGKTPKSVLTAATPGFTDPSRVYARFRHRSISERGDLGGAFHFPSGSLEPC